LDPQYSLFQAIACGALAGNVGLLTPLDCDLRTEGSHAPQSKPQAWSATQAHKIGASGIKLYLAYHPEAGERTRAQEALVRDLVAQCAQLALPFFLEPVISSIDPDAPIGSARFASERRRIAIEMVKRVGALGVDVLKLEFPVDGRHEPDEAVWRAACAELSDASPVPWTLLSAGDPFEMFKTQLQIACEAGCSGFMAGRAVWSEAATAPERERGGILEDVVLPRMEVLNQIANRYGHSWEEKCPLAEVDADWPESS
jgi:tagatose-1,6-bisphosphate aldolase